MAKQFLDYDGLKKVLKRLLPGARKIWHGTQAEWGVLSDEEKDRYDQAEVINTDNSLDWPVYTTEEQRIGTWIDGKPIYRKVFTLTNALPLSDSMNWTNLTSIENFETLVSAKTAAAYCGRMDFFKHGTMIQVACIVSSITLPVGTAFIIEYTKTTD